MHCCALCAASDLILASNITHGPECAGQGDYFEVSVNHAKTTQEFIVTPEILSPTAKLDPFDMVRIINALKFGEIKELWNTSPPLGIAEFILDKQDVTHRGNNFEHCPLTTLQRSSRRGSSSPSDCDHHMAVREWSAVGYRCIAACTSVHPGVPSLQLISFPATQQQGQLTH